MTTIRQFRWFWAWDDEKEEDWLEQMAQQGYHFQSVSLPGFYTFEQGEPRSDIYRLDYFTNPKDRENYLQIFSDSGWEYMGEMNGWQYFRKQKSDSTANEIYSDPESKAQKYKRLLLFLVIFLPIYFNFIFLNERSGSTFIKVFSFVMFFLLLLYIYIIIRLIKRINDLRKRI